MKERNLTKPAEIIEQLRKGKMLKHPAVALYVKRAQETNDYAPLLKFLKSNPVILTTGEIEIVKEEFEKSLSPFKPYPSVKDVDEFLSGPLKLGYVNETGSMFGIPWDNLCLPIAVPGRVGSGKSMMIKNAIKQVIGKRRDFNILIPDLKKEYRHLYSDDAHLKILTQDRIKINPLQIPKWCNRIQDHIMAFAKCFVSENYLVGTSENLLIDLVDTLYRKRGIYGGSENYPTLADLYNTISGLLLNTKSHRYIDVLMWLQNRLKPYTLVDCFNSQFGIPFEVFQKENLVLEMDHGFTDRMYSFICATIANQLYMHNKMKEIGGTICHWFVVDEARILFNANRNTTDFGESILTEILTKSRAYGISFLLASPESASFNSVMRSLSYLKIAFPLNDLADLTFIQGSFGLTEEQKDALFQLPPYGMAVVRYGGYEKPFLLQVPKFQILNKLSDDDVNEKMSSFYAKLDRSIKKGPSPASVEIKADAPMQIPSASAALLFYVGKFPFTTVSGLAQVPGFKSPTQISKALDWLVQNDFIRLEKHRASKTKASMFPVLMAKAMLYLDRENVPGKGSFEHALYQHIVCEKACKDGCTAKVEGHMKNSSKLIDVLAISQNRKCIIAYEITLSFNNIRENIIRDFQAGVSEVRIICRDKNDMGRAMAIIAATNFPENLRRSIHCDIIDSYFS